MSGKSFCVNCLDDSKTGLCQHKAKLTRAVHLCTIFSHSNTYLQQLLFLSQPTITKWKNSQKVSNVNTVKLYHFSMNRSLPRKNVWHLTKSPYYGCLRRFSHLDVLGVYHQTEITNLTTCCSSLAKEGN